MFVEFIDFNKIVSFFILIWVSSNVSMNQLKLNVIKSFCPILSIYNLIKSF